MPGTESENTGTRSGIGDKTGWTKPLSRSVLRAMGIVKSGGRGTERPKEAPGRPWRERSQTRPRVGVGEAPGSGSRAVWEERRRADLGQGRTGDWVGKGECGRVS
jgi:hypothetical protein